MARKQRLLIELVILIYALMTLVIIDTARYHKEVEEPKTCRDETGHKRPDWFCKKRGTHGY